MTDKVKLKYTYVVEVEVERRWYSGNHCNEALDGQPGTNEHILAIESEIDRAMEVIEEQVAEGEGSIKVEIFCES